MSNLYNDDNNTLKPEIQKIHVQFNEQSPLANNTQYAHRDPSYSNGPEKKKARHGAFVALIAALVLVTNIASGGIVYYALGRDFDSRVDSAAQEAADKTAEDLQESLANVIKKINEASESDKADVSYNLLQGGSVDIAGIAEEIGRAHV